MKKTQMNERSLNQFLTELEKQKQGEEAPIDTLLRRIESGELSYSDIESEIYSNGALFFYRLLGLKLVSTSQRAKK